MSNYEAGTKELGEVVQAVASILFDAAEAKKDDGRISSLEIAGIIAKASLNIVAALKGMDKIAGEIRTLERHELDLLYYRCLETMGWNPTDEKRDLFACAYEIAAAILTNVIRWRNTTHPPKAIPVPE